MTVYQEAHSKIDQLPEETVYLFIQLMNKITPVASQSKNKSSFLASAGKLDIDEGAIIKLREASTI
ncbi:MAG: hypothetical protein IJV40_14625 [Oscillospiraceae bacterium]|nr:hypothetical protein [Oscillospiraceae bacterium]